MEYTGKRNDVVDFGGEADYGGLTWFADPPPKPPVRADLFLELASLVY